MSLNRLRVNGSLTKKGSKITGFKLCLGPLFQTVYGRGGLSAQHQICPHQQAFRYITAGPQHQRLTTRSLTSFVDCVQQRQRSGSTRMVIEQARHYGCEGIVLFGNVVASLAVP